MGSQELENLVSHKRVALETSVFILALEGNKDFPQAAELFRVLAVARAKMFASVLTITEVINKSYEIGDTKRIPARLNFIHGDGSINIVDVTQAIALKAAQLRAKYHLKTPLIEPFGEIQQRTRWSRRQENIFISRKTNSTSCGAGSAR